MRFFDIFFGSFLSVPEPILIILVISTKWSEPASPLVLQLSLAFQGHSLTKHDILTPTSGGQQEIQDYIQPV